MHRVRVVILLLSILCSLSSCHWQEAREVIAVADSIDQNEHRIYNDTVALKKVICVLDNPIGRLFHNNLLGKAYYYMGRNLEDSYQQIAAAAECYIEADRMQIDNPIYRGRVNSCMGYICEQNNNDSLALIFYERAGDNFRESKDDWYYAQNLLSIVPRYINLQLYTKADSILAEAKLYQLDSAYQARYYETLGLYFYAQQQYDSALVYFNDGSTYWYSEEDRCFCYLKIMRAYYKKNLMDNATCYAQKIVSFSKNPNYLSNAYYCLMQDAKNKDNVELLSQYSHARTDAQKLLRNAMVRDAEAIPLLEEYLQNPHPWRWGWISLVAVAFVCLLAVIGVVVFRKRTVNAHKQIDDLSNRLEEQEAVQSEQQRQYDADMCLADIRAKFPKPRKQWNDYNRLKKDLNAPLQKLLCALDNSDLGNKEKVFCVLYLVYSHCSLIELADYINYSEKGIRNYKQRIAQKLHISSAELYDFLLNQLRN